MTNASGALVWQRTAQSFGETYAESGSIATVLRFPRQVADAATATHYNMARDYDPTLGRYLQSDPIGLAGGCDAGQRYRIIVIAHELAIRHRQQRRSSYASLSEVVDDHTRRSVFSTIATPA